MLTEKNINIIRINDQKVANVQLNRPVRHNALDREMVRELINTFENLSRDSSLRVVLLTGEGESFCAGADIHWMQESAAAGLEINMQDSKLLADLFSTLYLFEKPLVAAVQGSIMGGGLGLMAACDYVFSTTNARFKFSEVLLGITPATIMPYILRRVSASNAKHKIFSAQLFDAKEAHRIGLVDEVVDNEYIMNGVNHFIEGIIGASPNAVKVSKKLINALTNASLDKTSITMTSEVLARIKQSEEAREGMEAFLQKRKPKW
jgi:methylglutaconyl-CoA hydratase